MDMTGACPKHDEDLVNHPKHYVSKNGMEVIDVVDAFTADMTGIEAFITGNLIKYSCRWKNKNGTQDLQKLVWYATKLIEHLEKEKEQAEKQAFMDAAIAIPKNVYSTDTTYKV